MVRVQFAVRVMVWAGATEKSAEMVAPEFPKAATGEYGVENAEGAVPFHSKT
jgi:hypothetical protein